MYNYLIDWKHQRDVEILSLIKLDYCIANVIIMVDRIKDSLIKTKKQPSIISMMIEIPSIRLAVAVNLEKYNLKGINYPSGNDD